MYISIILCLALVTVSTLALALHSPLALRLDTLLDFALALVTVSTLALALHSPLALRLDTLLALRPYTLSHNAPWPGPWLAPWPPPLPLPHQKGQKTGSQGLGRSSKGKMPGDFKKGLKKQTGNWGR